MSGPHHYAVTVIGNDRPGIVAGVTRALFETGCNLEDATSTILRGHFSMMLVISSDGPQGTLEVSLAGAADELGVMIAVKLVEEAALDFDAPTHMVSVYGADHPGIVFRISDALATAGANVTDLTSRIIGSPEEPVYALMMEVAASDGGGLEDLLTGIASEIGVDVSVHPIEADLLQKVGIRPVLRIPERVLKRTAVAMGDAPDGELVADLIDTMRASPGCVGLAAPQIGVSRRALALDVAGHPKTKRCHGLVVVFDPVVVESSGREVGREGCMSVPDLTANVARAKRVVVHGRSPEGEVLAIETDGFEARAFQHEIDHLDGLLILDRVSSLATDVFRRKVYQEPRG